MEYLNVGIIQNTHGLKGELKVRNISDFNRFVVGNTLYIKHNSEYIKAIVKSVREQKDLLLVQFEGLEDINKVLLYKGDTIVISKDDAGDLDDGRYYYYELIGRDVYNQNNVLRGKVTDILEYPMYDMLEIEYKGVKKLIPFIDEFIDSIDDDRIVIKEIEGLL